MSEKTLKVKILQRGDTEANWTSSNPVLLKNEMAISTDKNGRYKIGDGTSKWSELSYSKADPTSHTHTKSQITDFPSSLKNPYALTLQGNGTTLTNGTYDGSAAKTVNITPDSIGASPKEGNTSLSKLASTITLGDGASGTILQNSATYQQKIEILDNSTSGDAVFNFSQSTDSGRNFTSLMQIRDDGNIVANKFTGTLTGNADTATKLSTARTINGTSFDGSANITTANWGTARNIQIGNTTKSVNGSANVSWSLSEIGAAAASHGRHMPDTCETITDWNSATKSGWYMGNNAANGPTTVASGGTIWYFGEVIAYNINYIIQVVYQFTASTDAKSIPKYIRAKMNGTWGAWTNVTVSKAVPSNAVFTDTNTWRGVQDNLTSTATDQSLSANQGKVLKGLIDGKAASSHTHNYAGSSSAGGAANSATKLATARSINGTNFDGTGNITTANWGTARNVYIADSDATNTGAAVSVNGSGNATLKLPATIKATLSGNASTATTLATARNIKLTGDATGSASFNGSADASITTTLASSGVTAGSYGPSANASPAHKGTFSVPYFTVDAKGRVTAASTKTITLPADNNTTYSTGTSSTAGLTKLYTSTGTATDGTMTQNAINTALSGKSKVTIVRWS